MAYVLKISVKIPMMPKGVEHIKIRAMCQAAGIVKIPMMPKGVEHIKAAYVFLALFE